MCPQGDIARATKMMENNYKMQKVALEMNIVPGIQSTLVSVFKISEEDCITVLDKDEAGINNGKTSKITVSDDAILKGCRCEGTGIWRVPLQKVVKNESSDTIIIDHPDPKEAIVHYFEIPLTKKTIAYVHACTGLPVKEILIKAIRVGNYAVWLWLSVKAVSKHFPWSDETQKGHMKGFSQGIRSTEKAVVAKEEDQPEQAMKKSTICT